MWRKVEETQKKVRKNEVLRKLTERYIFDGGCKMSLDICLCMEREREGGCTCGEGTFSHSTYFREMGTNGERKVFSLREKVRERDRDRERERQTEKDREREREGGRGGGREREQ